MAGPATRQLAELPDLAPAYSKGGFGTKVHLIGDEHCILLAIHLTPGQRHDSKGFEPVARRVLLPHHHGSGFWPGRMAGDKGYSYRPIRRWIKRRRIRGVIPTRKDRVRDLGFEKPQYRRRNIVERTVGWYKECRRLATRYETLAVNDLAFWLVAIMEREVRLLGFSGRGLAPLAEWSRVPF